MTELGETNDPKELVPGDVAGIVSTMWAMRGYGDSLREAGTGLSRINTQEGWSGDAADGFRAKFHGEPARWHDAADGFYSAADALDRYANTLQSAQQQAAEAIRLYNEAQETTRKAAAAYDQAVREAMAAEEAGQPFTDPGVYSDPGEEARQRARQLLTQARTSVSGTGDDAARTVTAAFQKAPEKPGFWSKVGDALGDAWNAFGHTVVDVGDAFLSYGNAMLHHPEDVAQMLVGTALAAASGAGEVLGFGLDATGVGAAAGVPLNVASAAGITAGVGIFAMGAADLTKHATGEDKVSHESEPEPEQPGKSGTKTDRMKEHLTDRDLDAARRELNGEVVARKADGTPYDHVTEVREAQRGLADRIGRIKGRLGDPRLGMAEREALTRELSEASRLLDRSEGFVPR